MNISTTALRPGRLARSTVLPVASLSLKGWSFSPMATAPTAGRAMAARPTDATSARPVRRMFISLIRASPFIVSRLTLAGRCRQQRVQLLHEHAARHRPRASRLSGLATPLGVDVAEEAHHGNARQGRLGAPR